MRTVIIKKEEVFDIMNIHGQGVMKAREETVKAG